MNININCPRCTDGQVTLIYQPPLPGVHTMSNGDPGYPGDPECFDELEASCDCWPIEELDRVFNDVCQHCSQPFEAHTYGPKLRVGMDYTGRCDEGGNAHWLGVPHPVYTYLLQIIHGMLAVSEYYTDQAMAEYYAKEQMQEDI